MSRMLMMMSRMRKSKTGWGSVLSYFKAELSLIHNDSPEMGRA